MNDLIKISLFSVYLIVLSENPNHSIVMRIQWACELAMVDGYSKMYGWF